MKITLIELNFGTIALNEPGFFFLLKRIFRDIIHSIF